MGEFKEVPWHTQERENVLKTVGVKVEYREPVEKGEYGRTHLTVGDKEHSEIIRLYVEEGLSMNKIAEQIGRSSRTPSNIFTIITSRLKSLTSVPHARATAHLQY